MKAIVLYTSKTGFTQQYAQTIASRLNCEAVPAKTANLQSLSGYDAVVYGGWIFANKISGLARILPAAGDKLTVFAVGATPASQIDLDAMRAANALGNKPLYYLEGGFRYSKLGWLTRFMLKTVARMTAKKESRTGQDQMIGNLVGGEFDHTDAAAVEPLIASLTR